MASGLCLFEIAQKLDFWTMFRCLSPKISLYWKIFQFDRQSFRLCLSQSINSSVIPGCLSSAPGTANTPLSSTRVFYPDGISREGQIFPLLLIHWNSTWKTLFLSIFIPQSGIVVSVVFLNCYQSLGQYTQIQGPDSVLKRQLTVEGTHREKNSLQKAYVRNPWFVNSQVENCLLVVTF